MHVKYLEWLSHTSAVVTTLTVIPDGLWWAFDASPMTSNVDTCSADQEGSFESGGEGEQQEGTAGHEPSKCASCSDWVSKRGQERSHQQVDREEGGEIHEHPWSDEKDQLGTSGRQRGPGELIRS